MLRSLNNTESELLELCKSGSWESVSSRTQTHPTEAKVTDAARRGIGTTAVSIAIRSNAPLSLIKDIVRADLSQLTVTHLVRGTILHEAFKHRVDDDVLEYIVNEAIQFENDCYRLTEKKSGRKLLSIFEKIDEIGRTSLHYMVDRIGRVIDEGGTLGSILATTFQTIVKANPKAAATLDADGNTPLILLLAIPKFGNDPIGKKCEDDIFSMVNLMVQEHPSAVKIVRRLPRPWHFQNNNTNNNMTQPDFLHGEGMPSPLSTAILHGRSLDTIQCLLSVQRKQSVHACSEIITHHRELPIHIAVTINSSIKIFETLVQEDVRVVNVADKQGHIPLDWIWIRHVMDWCSFKALNSLSTTNISRRRYIGGHIVEWHEQVSNQYLGIDESLEVTCANPVIRHSIRRLREDLIERASQVLPLMATFGIVNNGKLGGQGEEKMDIGKSVLLLPLLHSTCAICCPLALVAVVCDTYQEQLQIKDQKSGRLPLHFAASRIGYNKHLTTCPMGTLKCIVEDSPVKLILSKFPKASRVSDDAGQLPVHIAINLVKEEKHSRDGLEKWQGGQVWHNEVVDLLEQYPEALHRRDGISKLFPFQQAAEGAYGDVELTFVLLRRDPGLIQSILGGTNE
jgi:hypothetical protein